MQNIEIVNDVLLLSGERPVVSLVTPVGRKGALSVSTAVEDIILLNTNWPFLKVSEQALAVTGSVVDHVALREVSTVLFKDIPLEPVQLDDLEQVRYAFARLDDERIRLSSDISATPTQLKIIGTKLTTYDTGDPQATIPLPDRFRPLLIVQATYRMAVDHLGDYEQAQTKAQEFATMARRMIVREDGMGARNRTMYRKRGLR